MIHIEKEQIPIGLIGKPCNDKDVKTELKKIFHDKCCYCETSHIEGEIDHFRPQSKFPSLINNWYNLQLCCTPCNRHKSDKFDELLVNPTVEFPEDMLTFDNEGKIFPKNGNERMEYTIKTCKLNSNELNKARFDVYQEVKMTIATVLRFSKTDDDVKELLKQFVINRIKNVERSRSFIAYRKYIVNHWLSDIFKEINN